MFCQALNMLVVVFVLLVDGLVPLLDAFKGLLKLRKRAVVTSPDFWHSLLDFDLMVLRGLVLAP